MSSSRRSVVVVALIAVSVLAVDPTSPAAVVPTVQTLPHHLKRGFRNHDPGYSYSMAGRAPRLLSRTFEGWPARGTPPAVLPNDGAALRANGHEPTLSWVGHATFLVQ